MANVIVYILQTAGFLWEYRALGGGVELMQFGSLARSDLAAPSGWWRLLTYMFVHDVPSPLHVGLNMLMLYICGRIVQAVLGGRALVMIYLLGGLLGGIAHAVVFPNPLIGASASAYALFVAVGMLVPEQRVFVLLGLIFPIRMRVKYLVLGTVVATVVFFVVDLVAGPEADIPMISNIAHLAHLGGALGGFIYCRAVGVDRSLTLSDLREQRHQVEAGMLLREPPMAGLDGRMGAIPMAGGDQFSMTEVDPILDKIAREGFLSLSDAERDTLQRGMNLMSRT
jgi:membrane associated rhomboid family serine protease